MLLSDGPPGIGCPVIASITGADLVIRHGPHVVRAMERFVDRAVMVTGGSRGLGRAIAIALGAEGAHVFVGYRVRADGANETVEQIVAAGGTGAPTRPPVQKLRHTSL